MALNNVRVGVDAEKPAPDPSVEGLIYVSTDTLDVTALTASDEITLSGGGVGTGYAVLDQNSITFTPTTPIDVATSNTQVDLLGGQGLNLSLTNPSSTNSMRFVVQAYLPNIITSARDASQNYLTAQYRLFRFSYLEQVGITDTTDSVLIPNAESVASPTSPTTVSGMNPMLTGVLAPGASTSFNVMDRVTFTFDTGTIDHIQIGTYEVSNQNRARLMVHGVIV